MTTSPTNESVAELLGVSHAAVSRWRSGARIPEIDNMRTIREVYGWSVDDQVNARDDGSYAQQFCVLVDRGPVPPAPTAP